MIKMVPVVSTNIHRVGYDEQKRVLRVAFSSGAVYEYSDVPAPIYKSLLNAPIVGAFFSQNIKGIYAYENVNV